MSVLEEIRSSGAGAHGSLDDAQTLVKRASEEAGDLAQSAAAHGWTGVAQTMEAAQEALDAADSAIGAAMDTVSQALAKLSEITDEMSSDEVASRLAAINDQLDTARTSTGQAIGSLDEARAAAEQADAGSLYQAIDGADEKLKTGHETIGAAVTLTESEQSEATAWGN
jgi:hypothetical protein